MQLCFYRTKYDVDFFATFCCISEISKTTAHNLVGTINCLHL